MTALVPYAAWLVPYMGPDDNLVDLEVSYAALAARVETERAEYEALARQLADMNLDLRAKHSAKFELLATRSKELKDLSTEVIKRQYDSGARDAFEQQRQNRAENAGTDRVSSASDVLVANAVAMLFRKISMLTHPDRSNNPEHHELFRLAKTARQAGDLATLQSILEQVKRGKHSWSRKRAQKIKRKLKDLQAELERINIARSQREKQGEVEFFGLYQVDPARAGEVYVNALADQVGKIENQIDQILLHLGRPPRYQKPQIVYYTTYTTYR